MSFRARCGGAALLAAALVLVGCESVNPNAPARVSGRVTYNGSPVTGGSITFHTKDGALFSAALDGNGRYSLRDIPDGEMVVTVETESVNPNKKMEEYRGGGGGADGMAAKYGAGAAKKGPMKAKGQGMSPSPAPEGAPDVNVTYMKIPAKYTDKGISDLKTTLKKGDQTYDVDLKD